jgi:zinc transporter ZupT
MSEAVLVLLLALLTAVATGLGALPFLFAQEPTRRWLGISNAAAAGLMLAASLGLAYEGALRGPLGVAVGTAIGLAFIVLVRRFLSSDEHPAVFAAGAMAWMVFAELLPDARKEAPARLVAAVVALSILAMLAFQALVR